MIESSLEKVFCYDQSASGQRIYAYVGGNPVSLIDPLGLRDVLVIEQSRNFTVTPSSTTKDAMVVHEATGPGYVIKDGKIVGLEAGSIPQFYPITPIPLEPTVSDTIVDTLKDLVKGAGGAASQIICWPNKRLPDRNPSLRGSDTGGVANRQRW